MIEATITDENTVSFWDISFTRDNLNLPVDSKVILDVSPDTISVVSEDKADAKMYLESLIWKGAYNELIVYSYAGNSELMLHSQIDEQVATDIGIKFDFSQIQITPLQKVRRRSD